MKRRVVLTPEHVPIELLPAGLGSRFAALLVDFVIVLGLSGLAGQAAFLLLPEAISAAVSATLAFAIAWSYHVYFEVRQQGRSWGKRLAGLRVVDGRGLPLTAQQSFVRNVLRALDSAPLFYGLGALLCALDRQHRRLGDFLADTVVVREARTFSYDRRITRSRAFNSLQTPRVLRLVRHRIDLAEREFLMRLVERSGALSDDARYDLMQEVGEHYRTVLEIEEPGLSGENLVRGLAAVLASGARRV
jgi:uncharacterized RDD family membrane protein YckC